MIHQCTGVRISNIHLNAPENSPNTDGIDITLSTHVDIRDSSIATGDDCIACGPGHGISVGSLGVAKSDDRVAQVHVQHCTFTNTQNGGRIKTRQVREELGMLRRFSLTISLVGTENPIIIDQHYCDDGAQCQALAGAVKVSDVTCTWFQGTSATEEAITLDCSDLGCTNIVMDHVNITSTVPGKPVLQSLCKNANGTSSFTTPDVPCLSR
ncbi:PREDICTED: probable polygalacturonase [Prunus dulcis]|uniref:PREDICTED: probable polygalacturonase n=1 Tax=Prunus dulcis TaxID=3755 RepID=A0A5E4GQ97_PRUDU|nr:PREDICTED: probable polygalacturonase [Prunus dulcis]VVA41773.1 PREDICTED: probable polygalacturonase [Prunus dulcis]